ncbi:MAG TPA: efflux RND transporter permease subunit, partial [bacterium]|nr:efflux RND transporter permease subunit [bacterium]
VFLPVVFVVEGISGQIFGDQALTITLSILVSLVVALTFTPMLAAMGLPKTRDAAAQATPPAAPTSWKAYVRPGRLPKFLRVIPPFLFLGLPVLILRGARAAIRFTSRAIEWILIPASWLFEKLYPPSEIIYDRLLRGALRRRGLVLASVAVLVLLTAGLLGTLGADLVPPLAQGEFTLDLELPEGTPLGKTETFVANLGRKIRELDGVSLVSAGVGVSREGDSNVARRKENRAEVHVRLEKASKEEEARIIEAARQILAASPDVSMKIRRPSLFTFNTPVEVDVYGHDLDEMMDTAGRVQELISDVDGVRDVRVAMVPGSPEIRVTFDREKLNRLGLRLSEVANTVQSKVRGTVATRFRDEERHIDIRVQNAEEERSTLTAVRDLIVAERDGVPIRLAAIASFETVVGPAEIHRLGNRRAAIVTANLAGRDLASATSEIREKLARLALPTDVSWELGGQNEEFQRSQRSLQMAIALAIFLVYLVMAAQFESFLYPFIIMFSVPLAMMGAVLGLWITRTPLSVVAAIGGIMLAGIVVNNGIILVDRINQLKRKMPLYDAVITTGKERYRPIFLTQSTTVLGLLPMALGIGEGAELRAPLAITVIFGLTIATILTLVVVPVAYTLFTPGGGEIAPDAARGREALPAGAEAAREGI